MNIKRFLIGAAASIVIVGASAFPTFAAEDVILSTADFSTIDGKCVVKGVVSSYSFGPTTAGGGYGGNQAGSCVVWESSEDGTRGANVILATPEGAARKLHIRHLDGYGDDSFHAMVRPVGGKWVSAGIYKDKDASESAGNTEEWITSKFDLSNIELGRGQNIQVRIYAVGKEFSLFGGRNVWGQLAIDWIGLLGNGKPR